MVDHEEATSISVIIGVEEITETTTDVTITTTVTETRTGGSGELVWEDVLTVDEKLALEGSFVSKTVLIEALMTVCYYRRRQFEKAEQNPVRVWKACLGLLKSVCIFCITT
ncbi:hypothetical protein AAE478_006542 [Parahypoxylon ruwenzoriense]